MTFIKVNLIRYKLYPIVFFVFILIIIALIQLTFEKNQKFAELLQDNVQQKIINDELIQDKFNQNKKYDDLFNNASILTETLKSNNLIINQSHQDIPFCDLSKKALTNGDFTPNVPYFISNSSLNIYKLTETDFNRPLIVLPDSDFNIFPIEIVSSYPDFTVSILDKLLKQEIKPYDFYAIYYHETKNPCKRSIRLYLAVAPNLVNSPLSIFGRIGDEFGQFSVPYGSEIDQKANTIFITDCTNNIVQEFDFEGKLLNAIDNSKNSGFKRPTDIKLKNNKIYIVDELKAQIDIFYRNGEYISSVGVTNRLGINDSIFKFPISFSLEDNSNFFVVDYGQNKIFKMSEDGALLMIIGGEEKFNGKALNGPYYAAYNENLKRLYVVDRSNNRIVVFDSDGNFLFDFGSFGTKHGQFDYPHEIEITSNNKIWVKTT